MDSADLALLVPLDALLQEGSVTGAARRLGLSTPATSHALARLRERLGDPLLVRSGRGMVLTPRAVELRAEVHALVGGAAGVLAPRRDFVPAELTRTFVVNASDYVLSVLGLAVDRIFGAEAALANVRFVPNTPEDAAALGDGRSDLAVGIYGSLPQEMRSRQLLTDRFVCVVRAGHPRVGKRLDLDEYVALPHIQVAPRGQPGGYLDDVLGERGLVRRVARAVPYFLVALELVAQTDYVLTVSERIAAPLASKLGLAIFEPPLALEPYALSLLWHPRFDADPAHRFLRDAFVRAAERSAAGRHTRPRTRLAAAGQRRKRAGRPGR